MSTVLVTGSEGSLGQAVIPRLIGNGYDVIGVDNLSRYGERLWKGKNSTYIFVKADLTDFSSVDRLFKQYKPTYVLQMAAQIYGVGGFNKFCADILGNDITLHDNILQASVTYNIERVAYLSSSMVYETLTDIAHEDDVDNLVAPHTEYGLSKFVGERLSRAYSKQYGLDYVIFRPFNLYSKFEPFENEQGYSHVFADFMKNLLIERKNPLPIIGDGNQVRCFTDVKEVAQVIANFSFIDKSKNQTFNLGNDEPITMRELAQKIVDIASDEFGLFPKYQVSFETIKEYDHDVTYRVPDVSKAKNILGWEAKIKIEDSIRENIKYLLENERIPKNPEQKSSGWKSLLVF